MPPSLWIGSARRRWASFWNRMVSWDLDHHILGNDHLNPPPPPHMIIPTSNNNQHHVVLKHKYVVALFLFLVCVDLIEIVGVLCYQLFTASYFPWHLYPMMLNRAMEIIALICSRGYIPSLYSAAQILLSLLSLAVYAKRQPCGRYHCAVPLVLYSILLSYETFVAVMVIKVSRMPMANDEGHIIANWPSFQVSPLSNAIDQRTQQPVGMPMIVLRDRESEGNGVEPSTTSDGDKFHSFGDPREVIVAVQQPDGEKLAIAKICDEQFREQPTPAATTPSPQPHEFDRDQAATSTADEENIQICHELAYDEEQLHQLPGIPLSSNSLLEIMRMEDALHHQHHEDRQDLESRLS
ncbi:hypothetical protein SELMODRAFT_427500 [Selaginella moellendorffii]|uniref:Uncharacterized protein n=1 Tax=Selaginella moellendorffii TaxID=88036 RepID=D8SZT6_SELML|nr:hypothetical protein SELMODRAFT_427500 [Selaginella moellendorffii]